MKVKTGIAVGMLAMLLGASCSLINKPCPDPLSCNCPTNHNPGCYPFPQDAKKPDGGSR